MQINQEIFLLVAEELSIQKAAKRACITQQCVSDHIKRMEAQYQVPLFTRRPHFQLTQHGEEVLTILKKMKQSEEELNRKMKKRALEERGSFSVGISSPRAQVILQWVLPAYYRSFPDVEIKFLMNDTALLEDSLLRGEIDLFLGINTHYHEQFSYIPICEDDVCIIVSDKMLKGNTDFLDKTINLKFLEQLPFVSCYPTSVLYHMVEQYADAQHLHIYSPFSLSDTATQIQLCKQGVCAAFVPRMLLSDIPNYNRSCPREQRIHILSLPPVPNVSTTLKVELVTCHERGTPKYIAQFLSLMESAIRREYQNICTTDHLWPT